LNPKKLMASDLMQTDLLTFREDMPLGDAISTLEDYHFTGAPVVDGAGKLIGVFTSTDVLKRRVEIDDGETPRAGGYFAAIQVGEDADAYYSREDYDEEVLGRDTVGQWMSTDLKTVGPQVTVEDVCRRMLDERIHRVLVVADGQLLGLISSFDIVRLVAGVGAGKSASRPGRAARPSSA
jgi:CBS domain-containing protein